MAKDPAFLFYPGDWLGGTLGMTLEEKGAYMEVLMLQFNRGHMEGHMIGQVVGQLWDKIKHKFTQDVNGLWYNVRLEVEKEKRQSFTATRRNNLSGTNQYTKDVNKKVGHKGGHMTTHMEDENVNENEVIIYFKEKGYTEESAKKFFEYYQSAGWKDSNGKKVKRWKQKAIAVWFKPENKIPTQNNTRRALT
jgi:hypothetical protein